MLGCCADFIQTESKLNEAFQEQFKTENRRIRGVLYLTRFNKDLDSLTYDFYIQYLDSCNTPSAKGLAEVIRSSDEHYFQTRKNSFLIALLYKKERAILIDDAFTNKLDTVFVVKAGDELPNLKEFSKKIKFELN